MRYIPSSEEDLRLMLREIGVDKVSELFDEIPEELRLGRELALPAPMTELELEQEAAKIAACNKPVGTLRPSFLGGGAYNHFVPSFVDALASRGEFLTAYTPYQAEASQGTLQAIFEYQTMISEITALPVANASLYDGATAVAEACVMAHNTGDRTKFLVSAGVHPETRAVLKTLLRFTKLQLEELPLGPDGRTVLPSTVGSEISALVVQSPNFFGCIEDLAIAADKAHASDAHLIAVADPFTLSILQPPGALGADICCGEAQVFGNGVTFGGPHLGYMACSDKFLRRIPGRLVGQTVDKEGKRAFTLTLQTREQHIRREKATSNICTNQGLIALRAAIYMAALGQRNFQQLGKVCFKSAHYLAQKLQSETKLRLRFPKTPFFREFAVDCPVPAEEINQTLSAKGLQGGLSIDRVLPGDTRGWLLATTDRIRRGDIDRLVAAVKEIKGCN